MLAAAALARAFAGAEGVFILPPPNFDPTPGFPEARAVIDAVQSIAEARGASMAQVALAWLADRPGVCVVTTGPGVVDVVLPLARSEVTARGIDQLVCPALGIQVQSGGARTTKVRLRFTQPGPGSDALRTCPLIM